MIKSLVIQGFKSFPKRMEIPFTNAFNAVIGPNGAGKSNLSDSICFVLGKSSAKDMRAEKSANLIYNGGKISKPAREASVSIVFDNSGSLFPVQEKEVAITRIVRPSGTSIYKINNETRTRQQVIDLLSAAHIDPDGHNIILQGDISRFVDMKTAERRELIEEVAGISVFEEKKQKAINELTKVEEKLNEAEIILAEREKTLADLKKDRDIALEYKELESNITRNKATRLHHLVQEKEDSLNAEKNKIEDFEKRIAKAKEEIENIKKAIAEKKVQADSISKELDLGKMQVQLSKELEDLRISLVNDKNREGICEKELEKISAKSSELKKAILESEKKIKELEKNEKQMLKEIEGLKTREKGACPAHKTGIGRLEQEINEKEGQARMLEEKMQLSLREIDRLGIEIKMYEEKFAAAETQKESLAKLDMLRKELEQASGKVSNLANECSVFSAQLANERAKLSGIEIEHAKNNALGEFFGDKALRHILSAKIEGVHGTISLLGKAEEKYALALETAAGQRLKSLVVSNDAVASKCISMLKEAKTGIATFLPLNKVRERPISREIQDIIAKKEEGVIGLASSLIKFPGKFKTAFEYVFGSTLVVDALSTARRIGIGKTRMVTLDGDLMETSGAMIGGYRQKIGAISGLFTKEAELGRLKAMVSLIETKKSNAEKELEELREKRTVLYAELKSLERMEAQFEAKDYDLLKTEIENCKKARSALESDLLSIKSKRDAVSRQMEKLKEGMQKALGSLGRDNEWQGIVEEITKLEGECRVNARERALLLSENEKSRAIIKNSEREAGEFAEEAGALKTKIREKEKQARLQEIRQKRFVEEFQSLFKKRDKLIEQVQNSETRLARDEERIIHLEEKKNEITVRKALVAGELEGLRKEFEQYKEVSLRKGKLLNELELEIKSFEAMLKDMGNVNFRALEVYERLNEEHRSLVEKHEKLKSEKEEVLALMHEIEGKKNDAFLKTFDVLAKNFREIFAILSTKGEASLVIENAEEPFAGGVDIMVKIAEGRALDIRSLSGGEKTLAALSFIFAIQEYDPAPFYLLDEVDAALDKKNSEFLSKLLAKYSKQAQYVVISHNDAVIAEADIVYGVSMQEGVSKIVSLKM